MGLKNGENAKYAGNKSVYINISIGISSAKIQAKKSWKQLKLNKRMTKLVKAD
jgi:hypothetical protein